MRIGISQRVEKISSHGEIRDSLDQKLIEWVVSAGETPVPVPNTLVNTLTSKNHQRTLYNWLDSLNFGALILSGGNDIGENFSRDLTENCLLFWAEKNKIPVLGICRGMQMMGSYYGIELHRVDGHVRTLHLLSSEVKNKKIFPEKVMSFHNLALEKCPNEFNILAKSEDGCLEAMRHKHLPWEGWMWHPERKKKFDKSNLLRFKDLIGY